MMEMVHVILRRTLCELVPRFGIYAWVDVHYSTSRTQ